MGYRGRFFVLFSYFSCIFFGKRGGGKMVWFVEVRRLFVSKVKSAR